MISSKVLNEGERFWMNTRTHPKAMLLPLLVLVACLALGVFVQTRVDQVTVLQVVWIVLGVIVVWRVGWPFLEWVSSGYAFTDRRIITRHGLVTRRGHDIPLARISDVSYEHGLIDRMLGCGTLVISDASTHGQVKLPDIPRVEENQRMLSAKLYELHGGASRGDEGA